VFHLDGIERQPFATKLHGVFPVTKQRRHPLLANTELQGLPHSRWNGLPVAALQERGYWILAHGAAVGADTFVKMCGNSLFVFFQGHPEYDGRALMREYQRDILRYVSGERDDYPALPHNYFDIHIAQFLRAYSDRLQRNRRADEALVRFQETIGKANLVATWRSTAVQLYRN
jgi:homoserine O-succinyltransferase/O-acetyltransferase